MNEYGKFGLLIFALLLAASPVVAADLTAEQIIDKSYSHNVMDFGAASADMKMDLIEKKAVVESRKVRVKAINVKEGKQDLRRALLTFIEPDDVAGTAFLSIEQAGDADDDQFLYLPVLKKALRKGGKTGKGESFMGTQFTYGDLESKDVSKAKHKRLPDEKLGEVDCYVIESTPNNPDKENYSKYISWVNKTSFVSMRIKLFDLKGQFQKVMLTEKVEVIDGKNIITQMTMLNVQSNKATRLITSNINTKAKLDATDFTKDRMTAL